MLNNKLLKNLIILSSSLFGVSVSLSPCISAMECVQNSADKKVHDNLIETLDNCLKKLNSNEVSSERKYISESLSKILKYRDTFEKLTQNEHNKLLSVILKITKWIIKTTNCGTSTKYAIYSLISFPLCEVEEMVNSVNSILCYLPDIDRAAGNQVFYILKSHREHCEKFDKNTNTSIRDITNDLNALDNLINVYNLGQQNQ